MSKKPKSAPTTQPSKESLVVYAVRMPLDLREAIYRVAGRQKGTAWTLAALRDAVERAQKATTK